MFVLHGHRLHNGIAVVLIASVTVWIFGNFYPSNLKLETEDQLNLKSGVYRIIGSGALAQSISTCLLVATKAIPLLHDGMKKRVKLFVYSTKKKGREILVRSSTSLPV